MWWEWNEWVIKNDYENKMCWFGNGKYLFGKASEQVEQKTK